MHGVADWMLNWASPALLEHNRELIDDISAECFNVSLTAPTAGSN